ncbi:hypothetical protein PoB_006882800 [Plakobranchus ocellatus]|uniref:Uncharacterized protein n=1 Tax=Plakobranchus ocellatus TaxID=259542 RepID=A0AAV4DE33_9GAST|nr:hypothetical protein PoB_006882800 [Plakobranchus ocellatus]
MRANLTTFIPVQAGEWSALDLPDIYRRNACPQQGDLRLSGPPSGQGTSGGAQTRNRRVPADLRADSLATVPLTFRIRTGKSQLTKEKYEK